MNIPLDDAFVAAAPDFSSGSSLFRISSSFAYKYLFYYHSIKILGHVAHLRVALGHLGTYFVVFLFRCPSVNFFRCWNFHLWQSSTLLLFIARISVVILLNRKLLKFLLSLLKFCYNCFFNCCVFQFTVAVVSSFPMFTR